MHKQHRNRNRLIKYLLFICVFTLAAFIGSVWLGWNITLWVLGIGSLFSIFSINIAPSKILRWRGATKLNRYYNSTLYDLVATLASRAELRQTPDLYLIKSKIPNAFALGSKDRPVVGISQGLVSLLSERELAGVLAHEISHIKNNDLFLKGLALSFGNLTQTLSFIGKLLLILSIPMYLLGAQPFSLVAILLLVVSPTLNIILQLGLSRSIEYLADYYAAILSKDPLGLASALHKIETVSRPWWRTLNPIIQASSDWLSSHPNTRKRIEKLQNMARQYKYEEPQIISNITIPSLLFRRNPYFRF